MSEYACGVCKDTGIVSYFEIDGMTIYRWQKPLKKACPYCDAGIKFAGLPNGQIWCIVGNPGAGKSYIKEITNAQ